MYEVLESVRRRLSTVRCRLLAALYVQYLTWCSLLKLRWASCDHVVIHAATYRT